MANTPKITIEDDNKLLVDGSYMILGDRHTSPEDFSTVMSLSGGLILRTLENMYDDYRIKYPEAEVYIGRVWLGRFATDNYQQTLTESGMFALRARQYDRGIFYERDNFKDGDADGNKLLKYWDSVSFYGLKPVAEKLPHKGKNRNRLERLHMCATLALDQ